MEIKVKPEDLQHQQVGRVHRITDIVTNCHVFVVDNSGQAGVEGEEYSLSNDCGATTTANNYQSICIKVISYFNSQREP